MARTRDNNLCPKCHLREIRYKVTTTNAVLPLCHHCKSGYEDAGGVKIERLT